MPDALVRPDASTAEVRRSDGWRITELLDRILPKTASPKISRTFSVPQQTLWEVGRPNVPKPQEDIECLVCV